MTIQTFLFAGADFPPGMDTVLPAGEVATQPSAVAKAFQGEAAVLAADAVIVADPFGVVTYLHSEKLANYPVCFSP